MSSPAFVETKSGLCKRVDDHWHDLRQILFDATSEAIPSRRSNIGKKIFAPSRCMQLGLCVCSRNPEGKRAALFASKLSRKFRQVFKKNTPARRYLDANSIVLKFEAVVDDVSSASTKYYHLGYCNLKTWWFSLMPMALDDRPPSHPGLLPLRLPNSLEGFQEPSQHVVFATHVFAQMDLLLPWSCQLCILVRTKDRFCELQDMQPEKVEIECGVLVGSDSSQPDIFFWRGWEDEKPKHSSRGPRKQGPGPDRSSGKRKGGKNGDQASTNKRPGPIEAAGDNDSEYADDRDYDDYDYDNDAIEDGFADSDFAMDELGSDESDAAGSGKVSLCSYSPSTARLARDNDCGNQLLEEVEAMLDVAEADGLINVGSANLELELADIEASNRADSLAEADPGLHRNLMPDFHEAAVGAAGPSAEEPAVSVGQSDAGSSIRTSDMSISSCDRLAELSSNNGSDSDSEASNDCDSNSGEREDAPAMRAPKVLDERLECSRYGSIRYNHKAKNLVAHCSYHSGNCRRTRTTHSPSTRRQVSGQGRPMGLLAAWLEQAANYPNAQEHSRECRPTHEDRLRARANIKRLRDGEAFSQQYERRQRDGEPEEPDSMV